MWRSLFSKKVVSRKRIYRFFVKVVLTIFVVAILCPILLYYTTQRAYQGDIYSDVNDIPSKKVAMVFGAAIWGKNIPSHVLRDRVLTAVSLYKAGKVERIIMSGDNRSLDYDEPGTMMAYAKENGVPEEVLQPDYAGRRTYDSCYRAKHIFGLEEAILITQNFHLPRAIYTCKSVGVNSIGLSSDLTGYVGQVQMTLRDIYALPLAIIDVNFRKPGVVLGERIEV